MAKTIRFRLTRQDDLQGRWDTALETWMSEKVSPKTKYARRSAVRHFREYLGKTKLWEVTKKDVIGWRNAMMNEGLADATVKSYMASLSSFYQFAVDENLFDAYPFYRVDRPKVEHVPVEYLTPDESKTLLESISRDTAEGRRDYALILLMLVTAMRAGEVICITVADLVDMPGGKHGIRYTPKAHATIIREIPPTCYQAILSWLVDRLSLTPKERRAPDGKLPPDAYVFTGLDRAFRRRHDTHLSNSSLGRIVAKHSKAAIGREVNPHALRHASALIMLAASGGDVKKVQEHLLHRNIRTTQDYVDHFADRKGELAQSVLDALGLTDA